MKINPVVNFFFIVCLVFGLVPNLLQAQAPTISYFSPSSAGGGSIVNIFGTNLETATTVGFSGFSAASFQKINTDSGTYIRATVGTSGASGYVSVTNPTGTAFKEGFTFLVNAPTIKSFYPTSSFKGQTVTIRGQNLIYVNEVSFGGVRASGLSKQMDSEVYITAVVDSGASGDIMVTSSGGTATKPGFIYSVPTIESFYPTAAARGQTVTIRGKNLLAVDGVSFGGVGSAGFGKMMDYEMYITATVGTGATGDIAITYPGGTATKSGFTFLWEATPVIKSFAPTSARTGQTVIIRGDKLSDVTAVTFGNLPAASFQIMFDTAYYISAVVGYCTSGSVSVTSPGGIDSKTGFTFISSGTPVIDSFSPLSASTGQTVNIRGQNLDSVLSVSFGGIPAASFQLFFDTAYYISAVVGSGASGSVSIASQRGTDFKPGFTFVIAPTSFISSFYPLSGKPGSKIYIQGIELNQATNVYIGNIAAKNFAVLLDTAYYIEAEVGSGSSGNIIVTKPNSTAISKNTFTVITESNDSLSLCAGGRATIVSNVNGENYQWQILTDTGFVPIANSGLFAGVQTNALKISGLPSNYNGSKLRCKINGNIYSKITTLKFTATWTGAVDDAWENTANWGCGQLPDANTTAIIYNGPVVINTTTTIKSLTVRPGVTVTVKEGAELIISGK